MCPILASARSDVALWRPLPPHAWRGGDPPGVNQADYWGERNTKTKQKISIERVLGLMKRSVEVRQWKEQTTNDQNKIMTTWWDMFQNRNIKACIEWNGDIYHILFAPRWHWRTRMATTTKKLCTRSPSFTWQAGLTMGWVVHCTYNYKWLWGELWYFFLVSFTITSDYGVGCTLYNYKWLWGELWYFVRLVLQLQVINK